MAFETVGEIGGHYLETIPADTPLQDLIGEMLDRHYSQMGITQGEELIGVVSLRSIARAILSTREIFETPRFLGARACALAVEEPRVIDHRASPETLFAVLGERSYVLVQDGSEHRIITDYDIRKFWRDSTRPFLLIEEVEYAIRGVIRHIYDGDSGNALLELSEGSDHLRTVDRVEQCSFAHYTQLFSESWDDGFDTVFHERRDFVRELTNRVGERRNQLFHFRVDDRNTFDIDLIEFAHGYFTSIGKPYLEI